MLNTNYNSISQVDWARLAAYIDSEGCIRIVRGKARQTHRASTSHGAWHGLILHVTNVDLRLLQWCKQNFGGVIFAQIRKSKRQVFDWRAYNKNVGEILRGCMPYFIVKREQAEIGLAFLATVTGTTKKLPAEVVQLREQMYQQMKDLKHTEFTQ